MPPVRSEKKFRGTLFLILFVMFDFGSKKIHHNIPFQTASEKKFLEGMQGGQGVQVETKLSWDPRIPTRLNVPVRSEKSGYFVFNTTLYTKK